MGSAVGKVRHAIYVGEPVITKRGIIQLDAYGRVTGAHTPEGKPIEISKEDLLTEADFLDISLFPAMMGDQPAPAFGGSVETPKSLLGLSRAATASPLLKGMEPEMASNIRGIMDTMAVEESNLNSEGKLDMTRLNRALTSNGLPKITGDVRDAIASMPQ